MGGESGGRQRRCLCEGHCVGQLGQSIGGDGYLLGPCSGVEQTDDAAARRGPGAVRGRGDHRSREVVPGPPAGLGDLHGEQVTAVQRGRFDLNQSLVRARFGPVDLGNAEPLPEIGVDDDRAH